MINIRSFTVLFLFGASSSMFPLHAQTTALTSSVQDSLRKEFMGGISTGKGGSVDVVDQSRMKKGLITSSLDFTFALPIRSFRNHLGTSL